MAGRTDRYPALAASALLHVAVLVAALVSWPWSETIHMGEVVPVTLISGAEAPAPAPAVQAPQPQAAATEAPEPQAPPQPALRAEPPSPVPPSPAPAKAHPQKVAPQPTPVAKTKPTPAPSEDWTALAAALSHQSQSAHPSSAQRGPSRPSQAVQARTTTGVSNAVSSAALTSLSGELQRLWNPNCDAPGGDVTIKVTFKLTASGRLDGAPTSSQAGAADPAQAAASDRAVRAVYEGEPFSELPPALYGQNITVNFNQKSYCSSR
ncbi:MAG TPA: energy transducer TonB [Caulobacteraceae bacterium]|nr:energy transducer TonB [Caulobacteraceae bacterium]